MSTTQRTRAGRGGRLRLGRGGRRIRGHVMVMIGAFQVLEGLVALFNDDFYVVRGTIRSTST